MTRQEFIDICRYYKGEEENPYNDVDKRYRFWEIEKDYVFFMIDGYSMMADIIRNGKNVPILNTLCKDSQDTIPGALIYYMFSVFDHFTGSAITLQESASDFVDFFNDYKNNSK